jgi:hypothetical protein
MRRALNLSSFSLVLLTPLFLAAHVASALEKPVDPMRAGVEYSEMSKSVAADKANFAARIVARWEDAAKASGRWNATYAQDFHQALMDLSVPNLIMVSEATSFEAAMSVLATGNTRPVTKSLGSFSSDLTYTPLTPCRILDTRVAGGILVADTPRTFDVDGSSFAAQGGVNQSCGVPFGAASAVAMTITVTQPTGTSFLSAWGLGTAPFTAVLVFTGGQTIANTTIVPVVPGAGNDFSMLVAGVNTHVIADVVGYFAAPIATPLSCTSVSSAVTAVPYNVYTAVDATCPAGYVVTGGGSFPVEGTLGRPWIWNGGDTASDTTWRNWVDNQAGAPRSVQTWARCCRVPGR